MKNRIAFLLLTLLVCLQAFPQNKVSEKPQTQPLPLFSAGIVITAPPVPAFPYIWFSVLHVRQQGRCRGLLPRAGPGLAIRDTFLPRRTESRLRALILERGPDGDEVG